MVLQSRVAIGACSLSVLGGSHPFVPQGSILRLYFHGTFSGHISKLTTPGLTDLDVKWPSLTELEHPGRIMSVTFSPNGGYLASASDDKLIRIWNVDNAMTSRVFNGHTNLVTSIAFSPDSRYLASASDDKSVRIWDVDTGMTSRILNGHTDSVASVAFSPDSRYVASASWDESVRIWDMDTGMTSRVLNGHTGWVTSVAFSPDSHYLASASYDKSVRIWDVDTGMTSQVLNGHTNPVTSVSFSPDRNYLASASSCMLQIWDVHPGIASRVLNGHTSRVISVTFSPNSRYLTSASDDQTVRVWNLVTLNSVSHDFSPLYYPEVSLFSSDGAYVAVSLRKRDGLQETRCLDALTLLDTEPSNPRLFVPSPSPEPFPSILLKGQSLCVQRGDTMMHLCWLPDHISVSTPIVQSGNTVCLGAHGGEVVMIDFSHFRLPEV